MLGWLHRKKITSPVIKIGAGKDIKEVSRHISFGRPKLVYFKHYFTVSLYFSKFGCHHPKQTPHPKTHIFSARFEVPTAVLLNI
jgi:hypothetical protein